MARARDHLSGMGPPWLSAVVTTLAIWLYVLSRLTEPAPDTFTATRQSVATTNVAAPRIPAINATTAATDRRPTRRGRTDTGNSGSLRRPRARANTVAEWPLRDPDYRAAKIALKATPTRCAYCGRYDATTLDHVPPLALHDHRRGAQCCRYVPACTACNCGAGGAIARARAAQIRPTASRKW